MVKYFEIKVDGQIGRCKLTIDTNTFLDVFVKNLLGRFKDITPEEYESGSAIRIERTLTPEEGEPFLMELYIVL